MLETEFDYESYDNGMTLNEFREPSFLLSTSIIGSPIEPTKPSFILGRYELVEELERRHLYTFENREDIYGFLLKASDLVIGVLGEAPDRITKLFGNVPLHLEVIRDPEEDVELLFIEIKTDLPSGRAVDLLDTLDDEWWLDVDTSVRKMLAVDA